MRRRYLVTRRRVTVRIGGIGKHRMKRKHRALALCFMATAMAVASAYAYIGEREWTIESPYGPFGAREVYWDGVGGPGHLYTLCLGPYTVPASVAVAILVSLMVIGVAIPLILKWRRMKTATQGGA